jgi:hypothetical protein
LKAKETKADTKIDKLPEGCGWRFFDDTAGKASIVLEPEVKLTKTAINRLEHINRIDDEIARQVNASRFVVADFTDHKGGVYIIKTISQASICWFSL